MEQKISIRFFNDCEVRAAWDDDGNRWMFAVVDVVAILTESKNPRKYWSVLKARLKKQNNELTTNCSQLKMVAADDKRYLTDCLAQNDKLRLVDAIPSRTGKHKRELRIAYDISVNYLIKDRLHIPFIGILT